MLVFSKRNGYDPPKEITFREELPARLRLPIVEIIERYVSDVTVSETKKRILDPYGMTNDPMSQAALAAQAFAHSLTQTATLLAEGIAPLEGPTAFLLTCPWFHVYDVIEDIFQQLYFYETELMTDPEEEGRAFPFLQAINDYFTYAGIGWKLDDNGKITTRGDEVFEGTVKTAVDVLKKDKKPTAAGHLQFAIGALSTRPNGNTSGAVAHATSAVECVLGEITGQTTTLGDYLKKSPGLFHPALKKGLDGIYGYASEEGARHGKEGTEPVREEAEFAVAVCAAVCTLLTRKSPKSQS